MKNMCSSDWSYYASWTAHCGDYCNMIVSLMQLVKIYKIYKASKIYLYKMLMIGLAFTNFTQIGFCIFKEAVNHHYNNDSHRKGSDNGHSLEISHGIIGKDQGNRE